MAFTPEKVLALQCRAQTLHVRVYTARHFLKQDQHCTLAPAQHASKQLRYTWTPHGLGTSGDGTEQG